jgi:hypothetical protein
MKEVLLMVGVLLLAMLGYYWMNVKNPVKKAGNTVPAVVDKQVYFENSASFLVNQETEVKLMVRDSQEKLVNYWVEFNYDPAMVTIEKVTINNEIFDRENQVEIDGKVGKVKIVAQNSKNRNKLVEGEVLLATIKIKNLKKGVTMVYTSRKPEIGILVDGKVVAGSLEMPNFKINIL